MLNIGGKHELPFKDFKNTGLDLQHELGAGFPLEVECVCERVCVDGIKADEAP